MSFQARLILVLLGALVLVQLAVWLAVDTATRVNASEHAEDRLSIGSRVLAQLLDTRGRQLLDSVTVIVADFGFKQAVATRDLDTIASMLMNHGNRVRAASVILMDNEGAVIASTEPIEAPADFEQLKRSVTRAASQQNLIEVVQFQGRPTQMALVPVRAPTRIGWVAMSFLLDDALLLRLRELTGLEVSLLSAGASGVLASTLPERERAPLAAQWLARAPSSGEAVELNIGNSDYLTQAMPLAQLTAILQIDKHDVLSGFDSLRERLWTILLVGLAFGALGASVLARGVTQPLLALARSAEQIGRGDYQVPVALQRRDELGVLADALSRMQGDIASREATIAHQAFHDHLTGLPNRAQAQRHLQTVLQHAQLADQPVAVLMLDLDRFKEINDTLGHPIGDQVLVHASRRMQSVIGDQSLLARLGGDEFLLIAECVDAAAAQRLAQQILASLASALQIEAMDLYMDASIGIALYPEDHHSADGLIRRADIAMYDAKQNGQRMARYEPGRDEHHKDRLALVNDLRVAIPRGELRLHFQPKWDLGGDCIGHAEALVRWAHPERGLLGPDRFVPLAEHSGRIRELTDWVLGEAIRSAAAWRRSGIDMGVAVNLSALDLVSADLPDRVLALMQKHGLSPDWLLLEITESSVMRDANHALAVLHRLRDLGFGLAIDDFGTGYSSLSHLRRLPVTEIKIDKSFVMNLAGSDDDDVIVRSTIELGHNMGLRVVAEGVEDLATLKRLQGMQCDQVQGYLVARPMPASELMAWFESQPQRMRESA